MTFTAFWLIVTSAAFHASWNLMAKKTRSTLPFYAVICSVGPLIWLHTQFWSPVHVFQLPWTFWAALACSVASDAFLYSLALFKAYKVMDMSTCYPIMRSLPIILTLLVTWAFGIGSPVGITAGIGMLVVFCGCMIMPLGKFSDFRLSNYFNKNMLYIAVVALGTTGYTVFDKIASGIIRDMYGDVSSFVRSTTFYSTRGIFLASTMWIITLSSAEHRATVARYFREKDFMPWLAGLFASSTYILVLIAMNYVTNVSYVQVFRQLGLPIGMIAGFVILKERCMLTKCIGVVLILAGLVLCVI